MAKIKETKLIISSVDKNAEQMKFLKITGMNPNQYRHFRKQFDSFLYRYFIIWLSNSISKYLLKKNENLCLHRSLYTNIITTIFIITQIWKQSKCPSTGKLDRPWCILTMEYYWAIKSAETLMCENVGGSQRHYVK